jgi:Icc protein
VIRAHCAVVIVQLSDPHIGSDTGDPETDLRAAVAAVAALRPAPDAVLVSGDVAEHATREEYERASALLAPLRMPIHVLVGNHDDRDALRAAFPPPQPLGSGAPQRFAVRCGPLRLVACDTVQPDRDDGRVDAEQREWLERELAADTATPTIVAMHHPPFVIGMPALDRIGMHEDDRRALGALLGRFSHVQRVVTGHVHLAAAGQAGGCSVLTCPSTWRMRPRLEPTDERLVFTEQPAGFALHTLVGGTLVSHVQPLPA